MANVQIYQGAQSPEAYQLVCESGGSGVNMTTIVSGIMRVRTPSGKVKQWSCAISGASSGQLTLSHILATQDTTELGTHTVMALLYPSVGQLRAGPTQFDVLASV